MPAGNHEPHTAVEMYLTPSAKATLKQAAKKLRMPMGHLCSLILEKAIEDEWEITLRLKGEPKT